MASHDNIHDTSLVSSTIHDCHFCYSSCGFPHYTMSVCCLLFFRVQRKVVSLCVYREGDWLRLQGVRERYDSINTLVMRYITTAVPISIGDHTVLAFFQYPVYSSK